MAIKKLFPQTFKNWYHFLQALLANLWYGFPSKKIQVIGVTGTNGKTTTCQLVTSILEEAGHKVALASTINFKLDKKEWVNKTKFTTVSAFAIQKFIAKAVSAECDFLVLETSSHALDQYRVWGVEYTVAVITNVTREHLDYHKTMEEYRSAKKRLFLELTKNSFGKNKKQKAIIVNLDMEKPGEYFLSGVEKYYGYTLKEYKQEFEKIGSEMKISVITAKNIQETLAGSSFQLDGVDFWLRLLGRFNIENALAAVCVGLSLEIGLETAQKALAKFSRVPGRMDEVENARGLKIIIDYALTPDSMEKLGALVSHWKNEGSRLVWVFGSCGERDRGKRPLMGEIVSRYADFVLVTNEDPYSEDPVEIINQVFSGIIGSDVKSEIHNFQFPTLPTGRHGLQTQPKDDPPRAEISNDKNSNDKKMIEGKNCWRILDRREAIKSALKIAKTGDIILVTGKGAEETMAIGKKRIPWNDRRVIEEELSRLD